MRKGGANDANLISPGAPMRPHAPHTCCRARPGWWQDIPPGICAIQPVICIPGGSATLSPAVEANPKMAIGIILERDDLFFCPGQPCPPYIVCGGSGECNPLFAGCSFEFFANPSQPSPLSSHDFPMVAPNPYSVLRHSQGLRFACPCRCGAPHKAIGSILGNELIFTKPGQPCPPYIVCGGSGGSSPLYSLH